MSGKNFMSYGDADTILTEFSNDIKSRVSTKANQGLTAQQIANAKANIDIDKVPNVATNDQTPTFLEESARTNIASGDKLSLIFGKIKKFFSDLKAVAFSGSYNDLSNKPTIPSALADLTTDNVKGAVRYGKTWGTGLGYSFDKDGLIIDQRQEESSGAQFNGDCIIFWSPADGYCIRYFDEDNGNEIWNIDSTGKFSGTMDASKLIKVQSLSIDIPAVGAGRECSEHKTLPTVSGYKAIGIIGISVLSNMGTLSLVSFSVTNTDAWVHYKNDTSSATTASSVTLTILYMKT